MSHAFIKQTKREVSNQSASKCYQNPSVFPRILGDIALLTHCIILDVNRAGQACNEGSAFHLQHCCPRLRAHHWVEVVRREPTVEPLTLDFGITNGRCKAFVQSLSARTASLMSLERMPRRISGGFIEGSHPSAGAGCDTATCKCVQDFSATGKPNGWLDLVCPHLDSLPEKLSCLKICCQLSCLSPNVSFCKLLQQSPGLVDTQSCYRSNVALQIGSQGLQTLVHAFDTIRCATA